MERGTDVLTERYLSYDSHKESDVDFLGSVPEHWNVFQLKRSVDGCVNGIWGSEPQGNNNDTVVLRVADFDREKLSLKTEGYTHRLIEEKDKPRRRLKAGDLLLEKSGGGEKTLVGQVVLFDKEFEAVTSNFVAKMTPSKGFSSNYLNYVFARFYSERINYCSIKQNTGIQNLDSGQYLSESFAFPPEIEQRTIANFLDHETAKINTLIDKQQQLIKLLKEKRQAVISHAVTKGLNSDAPMKDSGIKWLGEVPECWFLPEISHVGRVVNGSTPDKSNLSYWINGTIPWLASGCLNSKIVIEPTELISKQAYEDSSVDIIPSGSILVGMVGQGKTRGTSAILGFDSCINQNMAAVILDEKKIMYQYLYFLFQVMYEDLRELGRGGNQAALNCEIISSIRVPLPPLSEQKKIVLSLKNALNNIDKTMALSEKQILLLKERRTALISAAVTGKIDVRNWSTFDGGD